MTTLDSLSYCLPARLRIRLCRCGLSFGEYERHVKLLRTVRQVPLVDLSHARADGLGALDPRTFPKGCISIAYHDDDDGDGGDGGDGRAWLHDFEPWRRTQAVIAVGGGELPEEAVEKALLVKRWSLPAEARTSEVREAVCELLVELLPLVADWIRQLETLPHLQTPADPNQPARRPQALSRTNSEVGQPSSSSSRPGTPLQRTASHQAFTDKARLQGKARIGKAVGDIYLVYGFAAEALKQYSAAATVLRTTNDLVWCASAYEGIARCACIHEYLRLPYALPAQFPKASLVGTVKAIQDNVVDMLDRTLSASEPAPVYVYALAYLRMAHFLIVERACDGGVEAMLAVLVDGKQLRKKQFGRPSKATVSEWIASARDMNKPIAVADRCRLLSYCAALYRAIGFHRKAGSCLYDVVLLMTPKLLALRAEPAVQRGMHPSAAAGLAMNDNVQHAIRSFVRDCRIGLRDLMEQLCNIQLDRAHWPALQDTVVKDLLQALENSTEYSVAGDLVGNSLRAHSARLDRDEQTRLSNTLARLVTASRRMEKPFEMDFWDDYLVRDVYHDTQLRIVLQNPLGFDIELTDIRIPGLEHPPLQAFLRADSMTTVAVDVELRQELDIDHLNITVYGCRPRDFAIVAEPTTTDFAQYYGRGEPLPFRTRVCAIRPAPVFKLRHAAVPLQTMYAHERRRLVVKLHNDADVDTTASVKTTDTATQRLKAALKDRELSVRDAYTVQSRLYGEPSIRCATSVAVPAGGECELEVELYARPELANAEMSIGTLGVPIEFDIHPAVEATGWRLLTRDELFSRTAVGAGLDDLIPTVLGDLVLAIDVDVRVESVDTSWTIGSRVLDRCFTAGRHRMLLPMQRMRLGAAELDRPIPTLGDRQFVLRHLTQLERELFWYEHSLHATLRAAYRVGGVQGDIGLDGLRLYESMLRRLQAPEVEIVAIATPHGHGHGTRDLNGGVSTARTDGRAGTMTISLVNHGLAKEIELDMTPRTAHADDLTATDLGNHLLVASKPRIRLRLAAGEARELSVAYAAVQSGRYRLLTCTYPGAATEVDVDVDVDVAARPPAVDSQHGAAAGRRWRGRDRGCLEVVAWCEE